MHIHSSIITGLLLAFLLLASCSSGEEVLKEEIPPVQPEEKIAVSFSGRLELTGTKAGTESGETGTPVGDTDATQTLRKDVNVTIRAYQQQAIGQPTAAAQLGYDYKVQSDGSLTIKDDGEDMLLAAGGYGFYALSVNAAGTEADSIPPALTSETSAETGTLKNNTDYLYCAVSQTINSDPDGAKQNVSLSFSRLAARLQITIVSEGGDDKITEATAPTITLPLTDPTDSKITLGATPAIGQYAVASVDATLESKGNIEDGFTASCILLPMTEKQKLPVRIIFPSITFNGLAAQTDKLYETTITTPTGGFASGKQYNYTVNITGNQIGFTGLSVTDWVSRKGELPKEDITEDFD